jgi:hypothetical protein
MIRFLISAYLAGTIVVAEQTAPPAPPAGEPPSIQGYGDVDTNCQQWSDACRACGRGNDGAPVCSNIGIACQPKAVQCTARKEVPAK